MNNINYKKGDKVIFFGFGKPLRTQVVSVTYLTEKTDIIKWVHIKGNELKEEWAVESWKIKMEGKSDYYIDMSGDKREYDIEGFLLKYNIENVYQLENLITRL